MKYMRGIAFGVFDLFHIGHLRYLEYAARYCDELWVGVRADNLSTPGKPYCPTIFENQRCEIIDALSCVACAFVFQTNLDDSKYWLNWLLKNDIRFCIVGGEWENSKRWNALESKLYEQDIKVVYAPRTADISTSAIKDKLSCM